MNLHYYCPCLSKSPPLSGPFQESYSSSVIYQKDEPKNGCYKKTKHAELSKKGTFLTS